jgi:hypothetical protein
VSLYIDDPAADDIRPTKDIDITAEIVSPGELEEFRNQLVEKGFTQDAGDDVICRFRYGDVKLDVMSTKAVGWAPSDKWFAPGFSNMEKINLDEFTINIMPLPYFIAAKFSAHYDRGGDDPRASHDFEDIVYILDNRLDLVQQLNSAPNDVRTYLRKQFSDLLKSERMIEAIEANLFYETRAGRMQMLMNKLKEIIAG